MKDAAALDRMPKILGPDSVTVHVDGPIYEWVLVPRHPTMEMLKAAGHACDGINLSKLKRVDKSVYKAAKRWEAMLAAAPTSATATEYVCKCGVRVDPHRCQDGTDF